jgi:hypothetical protein
MIPRMRVNLRVASGKQGNQKVSPILMRSGRRRLLIWIVFFWRKAWVPPEFHKKRKYLEFCDHVLRFWRAPCWSSQVYSSTLSLNDGSPGTYTAMGIDRMTAYCSFQGGVFRFQEGSEDLTRTRSLGQKRGGPCICSLWMLCFISHRTCLVETWQAGNMWYQLNCLWIKKAVISKNKWPSI